MATKLQYYQTLSEQTLNDLTARRGNWQQFLDTAARLYKYPFPDQLMIFAQKPDATACAEIELWNEQFKRWVRRDSKGIALIDDSGSYPQLKYVFDVSDTEPSRFRSRPVQLWEMKAEYKPLVLAELAKSYENVGESLGESFLNIAGQLAAEYYDDNAREIWFQAENSLLEPPDAYDFAGTLIEQVDDQTLKKAFTDAVRMSVAYSIMARCGLDASEYFDEEDFQQILKFNTPDMVNALGAATADLSGQVLRDIQLVIRKYERVQAHTADLSANRQERSEQNYDRNREADDRSYLQPSGGLSPAGHHAFGAAEGTDRAAGTVRPNQESVPQRTQADNLQPSAAVGETVSASEGSGRGGDAEARTGDERADGTAKPAGQGGRPDGVDGGDERPESAGGRNGAERTDLRVEEPPDPPNTFSQTGKSPIEEILSTSPISLDEVDSILRDGGNSSGSYLRIAAHFAKGKDDNADFLRREYVEQHNRFEQSGKGFDFGNRRVSAWFDENGISLAVGVMVKNNIHKVTIPWETAAERVNQLMRGGIYVDRSTFDAALDNERRDIAGRLLDFYRDDMHSLPEEWNAKNGGYPEDKLLIKTLLDNENDRQTILGRLEADVTQFNHDIHERSWHNPDQLLADMRDAMLPPVIFPGDAFSYKRDFDGFITEDEVDAYLTRGGNYSEGKFRILSYFLGDHTDKDRANFVKNEYGHGGQSHALGGADNSHADAEPGKGLTLSRGRIGNPYAKTNLNWNAVRRRIRGLIENGLYLNRAELDRIPNYEKLILARRISNFFYDLPEEYARPFAGLDFNYPHDDEWQAIRDTLDNPESVDALLAQMQPIYVNMLEEDRYYNSRKAAWDSLNDWRDGTFTLFPGVENLPEPGMVTARRFDEPAQDAPVRRETIIHLGEEHDSAIPPQNMLQLSIFGVSPLPVLLSVEDQRTKIDDTLKQEAASIEASADAPFLNIADSDKARIVRQFMDAPRSREAVNLVKEVYGDTLGMPLPQAIKRISELVADEKFAARPPKEPSLADRVREELSVRGFAVSDELIEDGIREFSRFGDFQDIADNIENEWLSEELSPEYDIPQQEQTDERNAGYLPLAEPEPTPEPLPPPDFDAVAQMVYDRVIADEKFAYHLQFAQSRSSLRPPLHAALETIVGEMKVEDPSVYSDYFTDDITDDLFDHVYRKSRENRPQAQTLAEQETEPQFTEITDPAEIAEVNSGMQGGLNDEKPEQAATPKPPNFIITDDHLGEGGAKTKFRNNLLALQTLKDIEFENRNATPDEQETLSRYIGWGGLPQAFDSEAKGWESEYLELNALLTPEEFASARASTLNAHYTSPTIIKAMWEAVERLGFKSGNVLEPSMGVGNFYGLLPDALRQSKLYGVELDSVTARIAKQLYPNADIRATGFEKVGFSDSFFDIAIGNVPFGAYDVLDKRYEKLRFSIHNYFFAKSLDLVRPGGVVAFITSKFTMDERNPKVRKYLAERAELLGAVRLPNTAFLKNAGTETTMDILFLQKRDRPIDAEPDWVHLGLTEDGIPVNRYFLDNPEMLCGTMGLDERMNHKYGRDDCTACLPTEGADLSEQLRTALSYIEGEYTLEELEDLEGVDNHAISADPNVKNFSYSLVDGRVHFRENSLMYPVELPVTTLDRIKSMIGLRDCVHGLMQMQIDDHSEAEIKAQQAKLNMLYDKFSADYGLINSTANSRAFNADSAYYLLSSLEILNEDGELERKADMFTKRTIKQKTVITHVDTASEALAVSIGEKARVDLDYMSELSGKNRDELLEELTGVVFLNIGSAESQERAYVTADEYLSGNVREKLRLAEAAAQTIPSLQVNVEALKAIQPKDLEAGEIAVRLGATWIDPQYVQEFMYELLDTSYYNKRVYQVHYHAYTGEWQITGKGKSQFSDINATVTYGTGRMNAYQIIDDTLNLRDVRVYDYVDDADGKERRVLNKKATTLAQQKQELIKQAFKDWIWKDPERRQTLIKQYNERFNSVRTREYDGSHIVFPGISPEITLRPHQLNAIAHILYGGNTLLAHEVGAGKTFEMVGAAMEAKRLGLCNKSMFTVPNHLTEQWAGEFLRLYPSANILVATKKEFEMRNRKKFCAKIATGDYDAVIIGHSQLEKIPLSRERQERLLREQLEEIEDGIRELKDSNGERFSIKQLEKTKKSLEVRLSKLLDAKKRDDVVTFEQLGVDRLYIDEAHNFKNLFLYTKMRNVAGLSTTEAAKSSDLFMKCRYLDELTGGKGIIFATGTPISNSITELFTMQRYLQHDTLVSKNLIHFDAWASIFGETATSIELAPEGTGYRARTRFAKFHNLPELMTIFRDVADIQTADMLNLPVPDVKYENIIVEPSDLQKEMVEELSERAAAVHNRKVEPNVDNMLKITTDGRKIGLDQRLMNPLLPDFEGSKVNACTDKVFEIWNDTSSKRLTQLVFCDFSTPNKDGRFNVYDDIKVKLMERGIPEHEIAFIHDADTETRKKELFAKVRQGKIRVLFGSTFKLGAGTNVQDRLIAIHDADCPWRPADLAQRAGRIVRQGNNNAEVSIFRYATSGTFDSYLWQTVQKKQEFIAQIMSSKSPVRSCEDVDETALSYAEIKALCAGNPLIAEKMALDNEVAKLRMLRSEHRSQHYRLEDSLLKTFPQQIKSVTERIDGIEKDIAKYVVEKAKTGEVTLLDGAATASAKFPGMTVKDVTYSEKEPAAKALLEACKDLKGRLTEIPAGDYMGFNMSLRYESFGQQINLLLRGAMTYQIDLGTDALGNITRVNNALESLPKKLEGANENLANIQKQIEAAKLELEKPFMQETELAEKEARLALLNADLNIDGDGGFDVINDADTRVEETEQADNEPDESHEENGEPEQDESEPSGQSAPRPHTTAGTTTVTYGERGTGTYGKAKPSILDDLESFKSDKKLPMQVGNKSAGIDI
jgi:N12 class adenine-specific DNA methylase